MTGYDRVRYRSRAYPRTHPAHLAALSLAYGGAPARVETARILEIGCGEGGNLLPMAAALPGAALVGVDPAATAVAHGAARARAAGLANVELLPIGVEDLPDGPPFDFVIAHGVLSWIPAAARDALWDTLARRVAPGGVVFLSFNALPGWATRGAVADALRWHVRGVDDPGARAAGARGLLAELVAETPPTTLWGALLETEKRVVDGVEDWYLFHDHLADPHEPFWFADVAARAATAGLSFVGDAEPTRPLCPSPTLAAHARDAVEASQYGDLSRMTMFREVVFARDAAVTPGVPHPARMRALRFHARVAPRPGPDGALVLQAPEGSTATLTEPTARAVAVALAEAAPASLPFAVLADAVRTRAPGATDDAIAGILAHLWLGSEVIGARAHDTAVRRVLSATPRVWSWARAEAAAGPDVTTPRHAHVELAPLERALAGALDGTRDRAGLLAALRAAGAPTDDAAVVPALVRLASLGLLDG